MSRKAATAERYTVEVGASGSITLPQEVQQRLALHEGDRFVLSLESDGVLRLVSLHQQVKKAQGMFRHLAPGLDLAEELIRDRREEARREQTQ
jgi:hypothetical protein